MNTGFVHSIIRRSNRNLLMVCVGAALVVFAFAVINYRYLTNFVLGPLPLNSRDAAAIRDTDVGLRYYVTVKGDDVADTGFQWVSTSSSGTKTVKSSYAAVLVADKLLLVKLPGEKTVDGSVKEFTGALVDIPAGQEGDIIHKQEVEEPTVTGRYLPVMLDTEDFRLPGFIALVVGIVIYGACIYGLTVVNRRSSDPTTHPIMRALSRFG